MKTYIRRKLLILRYIYPFILSLFSYSLYATTLTEPLDLLTMAEQSDSVVVATPIEAINRRSANGNLFTEIILADTRALNSGSLQ